MAQIENTEEAITVAGDVEGIFTTELLLSETTLLSLAAQAVMVEEEQSKLKETVSQIETANEYLEMLDAYYEALISDLARHKIPYAKVDAIKQKLAVMREQMGDLTSASNTADLAMDEARAKILAARESYDNAIKKIAPLHKEAEEVYQQAIDAADDSE